MKKPTLKEVQEYFKNAKKLRSNTLGDIFILTEPFHLDWHYYDYNDRVIWSEDEGYAEIIKVKQGGQILDYQRKRLQVTVPLEIYDLCMSLVDAEILKFKSK